MTLTPADLASLTDAIASAVATKLANRPRLVDRYGLADAIGVSVPTIERLQREGRIVPMRIGRRCLYHVDTVIAALSGNAKGPDTPHHGPQSHLPPQNERKDSINVSD